jgi:NAD(P)-dependent dehydrogenase (short-subunit alcohol dehydrogenase family)
MTRPATRCAGSGGLDRSARLGAVAGYLEELFSAAGRVAVVTGGSSGIGLGMAEALGRAGARVVLVARGLPALRDAVARLQRAGVDAAHVSADLADRGALARACHAAAAPYGPPDILVNSAAVNLRPPLGQLTPAEWDLTIALNLTAPFLLGQHWGPRMAERGWGRIVNVASQQAFRAFGDSGGYGVSKGGIMALTRSQAEAWSRHGVCCNAVVPGFVHTPLTEAASSDPARSAGYAARTMIGRNGLPADFAGTAVYLAGRGSDYVTGQALFVDGGFSVT